MTKILDLRIATPKYAESKVSRNVKELYFQNYLNFNNFQIIDPHNKDQPKYKLRIIKVNIGLFII